MLTGLYIGRFQPLHKGHLSVIERALNEVDHLIIGIGSSQYSHNQDNPFTIDERILFVEKALEEMNMEQGKVSLIPIPDIHDNEKWPGHVRKTVGDFDHIYTGSDVVKTLFTKYDDTQIKEVEFTVNIDATTIREQIKENIYDERVLTPSTIALLKALEASSRLRSLLPPEAPKKSIDTP